MSVSANGNNGGGIGSGVTITPDPLTHVADLLQSSLALFQEADGLKWRSSSQSVAAYYAEDRLLMVQMGFKALFAALKLNPSPHQYCQIQLLLCNKLVQETCNLDLAESHILDGLAKFKYILHERATLLQLELRMAYVRVLLAKQQHSAVSAQLESMRQLASEIKLYESTTDPAVASIYYEFMFLDINMCPVGSHIQLNHFAELQTPLSHAPDINLAASLTHMFVQVGTNNWSGALESVRHVQQLIDNNSDVLSENLITSTKSLLRLAHCVIFLCGGLTWDLGPECEVSSCQESVRFILDDYFNAFLAAASKPSSDGSEVTSPKLAEYPIITAQGIRLDWFSRRESYELTWLILRLIFYVRSGRGKRVAETCRVISSLVEKSQAIEAFDASFFQLVHVAIAYSLLWQTLGHQSDADTHIRDIGRNGGFSDPFLDLHSRYTAIVGLHRSKEFERAVGLYRQLASEARDLHFDDLAAVCAVNTKLLKWYTLVSKNHSSEASALEEIFPGPLVEEMIAGSSNQLTKLVATMESQLHPTILEPNKSACGQLVAAVTPPTNNADGILAAALLCTYMVHPAMSDTYIENVEKQALRKAEAAESPVWTKTASKLKRIHNDR